MASVLTVIHTLSRGGTERIASNYARAFAREGHQSAVWAYEGGGIRRHELEEEGVKVFATGEDGTLEQGTLWALGQEWDVVQLHRSGWHTPVLTPLLQGLSAMSPAPAVIESNIFGKPDYSEAARGIHAHLLPSRWQLWKWRQWTRSFARRPIGLVLPSAVDVHDFSPVLPHERSLSRNAHGLPPEARVMGCIAQPSLVKWSRALFRGFERVAATRPDVFLVVVGLPDAYRSFIDDLPTSLRARVLSLPVVEGNQKIREYYALLDVFASAGTMGESFGMVFAEALFCGLPIVTKGVVHRDNSAAEVIGPGGYVAANEHAFAECLARLLDHPSLRAEMVEAGQAHIKASYASQRLAKDVLRLAEDLRRFAPYSCEDELQKAGWKTDIGWTELMALEAQMQGKPPLWQRAARRLLHHPTYYRLRNRQYDR